MHAFIDRVDSEITDPMNGLLYRMVNQLIEKTHRKDFLWFGFIADLPELNRFKSNMLFDPIPVSRVYILNPLLLPFIKLAISSTCISWGRNFTKSFARKIIRIYQGYRLSFRTCHPEHGCS